MTPTHGRARIAQSPGSTGSSLAPPTITAPPPTTTAPTPVPTGDQLMAMLPDAATASRVLGIAMAVDPRTTGIGRIDSWKVDPPECGGLMAIDKAVYDASPARNTDSAFVTMMSDNPPLGLWEAVTSFPDAHAARDFINTQAQVWPHCEGMTIGVGGQLNSWPIIEVNHDGDTLNANMRLAGGRQGRTQQRLLTVRGLVVIDITVAGIGADLVKTQALAAAVKDAPR
jgi:hypothetical protein